MTPVVVKKKTDMVRQILAGNIRYSSAIMKSAMAYGAIHPTFEVVLHQMLRDRAII